LDAAGLGLGNSGTGVVVHDGRSGGVRDSHRAARGADWGRTIVRGTCWVRCVDGLAVTLGDLGKVGTLLRYRLARDAREV
jgi:hypothetical protein